jgi:hypothetical protein
VGIKPSPIIPVETVTVRSARPTHARNGYAPGDKSCCLSAISISCLAFPAADVAEQEGSLQSFVRSQCRNAAGSRGQSGPSGSRAWIPQYSTYLGINAAASSTHSLCDARRRTVTGPLAVDSCAVPFFLPVRVLSRVFRGKFIAGLKRAFLRKQLVFSATTSHSPMREHSPRFCALFSSRIGWSTRNRPSEAPNTSYNTWHVTHIA